MCEFKRLSIKGDRMTRETIPSIPAFIEQIKKDSAGWKSFPWFRGEKNDPKDSSGNLTELLPKLYRKTSDGRSHNENRLLQNFRLKAPTLGLGEIPDRNHTDQWLFLAQHFGLPTRLLDWTESALGALYFALGEDEPVVWMLNPIGLNNLSLPERSRRDDYIFPLTWFGPETLHVGRRDLPQVSIKTVPRLANTYESRIAVPAHWVAPSNIGNRNIRDAWEAEKGKVGTELPIAILPTNIHPRMSVQKSCFTIHGLKKKPLSKLVEGEGILFKYEIKESNRSDLLEELRLLGVSESTLFPDLGGLAKELEMLF